MSAETKRIRAACLARADGACDHQKTNNQPNAAFWLDAYARHCERHGYTAEQERAAARLEFVRVRGQG